MQDMEHKKRAVKSVPHKGTSQIEEANDHFHGPDTSSLTAFLLSLFSCSEAGVRCGDDPSSLDNDNVVDRQEAASTSSRPTHAKGRRRARDSVTKRVPMQEESMELGMQCMKAGKCKPKLDNDENEWQLITKDDLQEESERDSLQPGLPGISHTSLILPELLRGSLCSYLPTLVQGREWVLLYSTWKHGTSLRNLYWRSAHISGPCLLVVEDTKGTVFGGLFSAPLNPTKKHKFQGTNDSFVFSNVSSKLHLFRPTGFNRYFYLCTNNMLACGGGGAFALHLDEDLLHGSSGHSETFGNSCLAHAEEFSVRNVELWGFAHTSKYVPKRALYEEPLEVPGVWSW